MTCRFHPLLITALGASALCLGGMGWLASGLRPGQLRPPDWQVLDLMMQAPAGSDRPPRQAPPPPRSVAWQSPMDQACPPIDPALRQRLLSQRPRLRRIRTDPTNFGERFAQDAYGNRIDPTPRVVVLHETVYGIDSAIATFLTPHPRDEDQVSYHALVGLDGQIVQVLDPSKRAFGAGNSAFRGEWVVTNPKVGGSINNFALHLSLETPLDGENDAPSHSGYSQAQYDATALQLAEWMRRFNIPWQNITTHRHVDLGGERADPRSFDWQALKSRLIALGVAGCST